MNIRLKFNSYILLLFVLSLIVSVNSSKSSNDDESEPRGEQSAGKRKVFIPSKEWQEVKDDDILPPKFHYRINLETGVKEAKLLENDRNEGGKEMLKDNEYHKAVINVDQTSEDKLKETDQNNNEEITIDNDNKEDKNGIISDGIKTIKQSGENVLKAIDYQEVKDRVKEVKSRFKSIEVLKKEFEALNLNPKTETEVVNELMQNYLKANNEQKISILQDIEYHIHHIDVAIDFIKLNGLKLILPDLNNSDSSVRAMVALTLGSAMQNNVKVQIAVLESNAMDSLLRVLSLDPSKQVKSRALFAVSSLIRQFPYAQKHFIKKGGVSVLASLFKENNLIANRLKVKVLSLLYDLLTEQESIENSSEERMQQYQGVRLKKTLEEAGFCSLITSMLNYTEPEVKLQILSLMNLLLDTCRNEFKLSIPILTDISLKSASLDEDESRGFSNESLNDIHNLSKNLLDELNVKIKTEL
ncbi:nucleotide exchange factor SIL1-like protein [Dinothrombium tinctorium]|uniref:Nucleotide exchange factor SIL1 n=1 Tax=Dinothrombium tinctorium TaxID=1965070 RepID=A0A443QJ48_9ACAR|nr:nucleotide exchange factor SIL1-like protein [Dinothrombium tinctorium]